jgi:hypothetical protein
MPPHIGSIQDLSRIVPRWNLYEVERHVYHEIYVVYKGKKKHLRGIIEESENGKGGSRNTVVS